MERLNGSTWAQIAQLAANVTHYSNTGLAASTTYSYRVSAFNDAGSSAVSNSAAATTQTGSAPPATPSNLAATAVSASQINLSWNDNANNETGFKLERWTGSAWAQIAQLGANVTSYSNTGLTASTTYSYRVSAFNSAGSSAVSNSAAATTQTGLTPPAAPINLAATAVSTSQINLSWNDNANNETGFKLERWTGSAWAQIAQLAANVTSYSNTGLAAGTTYSYRVYAYNSAGSSTSSNSASATTQVMAPTAPSNLAATAVSTSQINLSWNDNSNNETGFKLERGNGSAWAQIAQLAANVTS